MTDIIFLLLIFFVLTSSVVQISDLKLPESDSKTIAPTSAVVEVGLKGEILWNKQVVSPSALKSAIARKKKEMGDPKDFTLTIAADQESPFDNVTEVIKVAGELRIKAILATSPKTQD
ncbi:MAG: biopolymer transporter ExbD [Saprospiraceae bacterium]|nr:biopolymer transporter ExbD [Saprospiraceae bacterium]MCF8249270.1 biopolymer transporter ExbD [Saprospiraceae bacterium]MCF8281162.1 biopolymer transporter ExbD [Bacteroidales bacterium]MCF8311453.1 biopolymer transporter ExbD [Saprospiraceae bacterium]MCF8439889.1 biopolymer transporter ExbD [Saprospiraceae bacterium]